MMLTSHRELLRTALGGRTAENPCLQAADPSPPNWFGRRVSVANYD